MTESERYKRVRPLGGGGMSEVLLAVDTLDPERRQVALKRPHAHVLALPNARAQFARECTALEECAGPQVPALYERALELSQPFFAMEYVAGADLRAADEDPRDALPLAVKLLRALAHVHARGWVHGDVNPSNVRARPDNSLVLLDFGVALRAGDPVPLRGALRGTLGYMAPEVILGAPVAEPGCDLFAVGVMLWQWLAQRRMFEGLEVTRMQQTVEVPAPPLGRLAVLDGVDLGPWLGALLLRDPTRRYPDARAALTALGELAPGALRGFRTP